MALSSKTHFTPKWYFSFFPQVEKKGNLLALEDYKWDVEFDYEKIVDDQNQFYI